jgi:hypothetical protein
MSIPLYQSGGGSGGATDFSGLTGNIALSQDADIGSSGFGFLFGGFALGSYPTLTLTHASDGPNAANKVMIHQFHLTKKLTIRKILWALGAVQAGKNVGMGIYTSAGALVVDTGALSINTGVAVSTMFSVTPAQGTVTLNPGVYWYAWTADTTAVDIYFCQGSLSASASANVNLNLNAVRYGHATNASVAGQLPATLGVVISDTSNISQPFLAVFEE